MTIFIVFSACVAVLYLYLALNPVFGARPSKNQKAEYAALNNYDAQNTRFVNEESGTAGSVNLFRPVPRSQSNEESSSRPPGPLPSLFPDADLISSGRDSLTWFGHSSFLLCIDNRRILIDPQFSESCSPVSIAKLKRFETTVDHLSNLSAALPDIDAVLFSHDHYDHLDMKTVKALNAKTSQFLVPLGVGAHLERWGVPAEKITQLNWHEEYKGKETSGIRFVLVPSRHFSGRFLNSRFESLWGGWVIIADKKRFYYSGDGGYGSHFKRIGDEYGPFDIAMIEGGQYSLRWPDSHTRGGNSAKVAKDVRARAMILMHWGAFSLSDHDWDEPIKTAADAAEELKIPLIAPQIGQVVLLDEPMPALDRWWLKVQANASRVSGRNRTEKTQLRNS